MYFVELVTSKSCNQNCYYCDVYEPEQSTEVDIDFLKEVLDSFPVKMGVEFTGGEIGLLKNLDEVFTTIYDHPNVGHIIALSNGLIRLLGVDWLDKVEYWEHLIYEVDGKTIKRFYDLDIEQKHRYVIVTTERTTKSLLANWEWFKSIGLFRPNFFYKMMNSKTHDISKYTGELYTLFDRLNNLHCKRMIENFVLDINLDQKRICSKNSPNPFVDLTTKEIGHCAALMSYSRRVPFSKANLILTMRGSRFNHEENFYCYRHCTVFDNGYDKRKMLKECRKGNYENRSYKNV